MRQIWEGFERWFISEWRIIVVGLGTLIILMCCASLIWIILPSPHLEPNPGLGDPFANAILSAQATNKNNYDLWYKSNIVIQCGLILDALSATILASITTKDTAERLKKWSIAVTAATATLASIQSTFHIRENIASFISAAEYLNKLEYDYLVARAPFESELRTNYTKDKTAQAIIPSELFVVQRGLIDQLNSITTLRMRAWASVGQQPPISPSPPH